VARERERELKRNGKNVWFLVNSGEKKNTWDKRVRETGYASGPSVERGGG
jgi:hypothetical protein